MDINNEIETLDQEIEALPEAGGQRDTGNSQQAITDMLFLADNIDKMIEAQNKIRSAVLKLAQPGDWVLFGNGEASKAEIGFAGAMRIGSTLGVSFTNWDSKKETGHDTIGSWYRWECECDVSYKGRLCRVYGRASSRDKFFGKEKGEYKELHEIDEGNIKIIARRSAMKEGVKVLFGLHHMDPEFIKKYGIKLSSAGGHTFKSQDKKADETNALQDEVLSAEIAKEGEKNGKKWKLHKIIIGNGTELFSWKDEDYQVALKAKALKMLVRISFTVTDKGGKQITAISLTDQKVPENKAEEKF